MKIDTRYTLKADEGKVLTNGEVYGVIVRLGDHDSPENWHEITEEEYKEIMRERDRELRKQMESWQNVR